MAKTGRKKQADHNGKELPDGISYRQMINKSNGNTYHYYIHRYRSNKIQFTGSQYKDLDECIMDLPVFFRAIENYLKTENVNKKNVTLCTRKIKAEEIAWIMRSRKEIRQQARIDAGRVYLGEKE